VFKLKGKPLNVMEATKDKIGSNVEVAGIMAGIGVNPGDKNPLAKIRFGRIIFLADPDVDGKHINTLLGGMFWKFFAPLYKEGRIYMIRSPEYMAKIGDKIFLGHTKEEVYKKAGRKNIEIQHIKGYGEIEEEEMKLIAFDKEHRQMFRLMAPDSKGAKNFEAMLGKDPTYRKKMLGLTELGENSKSKEKK
jgi:DNA gyrase/topoisomerase IV subunit B